MCIFCVDWLLMDCGEERWRWLECRLVAGVGTIREGLGCVNEREEGLDLWCGAATDRCR